MRCPPGSTPIPERGGAVAPAAVKGARVAPRVGWGSSGEIRPGADCRDGRRIGIMRMEVPIPIWMSSAIGVAVGVRANTLAAVGTVLALIILEVFRWVEKWMAPEANAHDEES